MQQFKPLGIEGLFLVENFVAQDERGLFVKTYHQETIEEIGFTGTFKESYYSQSKERVIRGMHFQRPPHDHEKLVYVTEGRILDVVLDLRRRSPKYGQVQSVELCAFGSAVFIPKGCAHGFLTLSERATVVYNVSTVYNKEADSGVMWDSIGFAWPVDEPILSARDMSFPKFQDLDSIF